MDCTVRDIVKEIERLAPLENCMPGDNCGLMFGSLDRRVAKVAVALDVNSRSVDFAAASGAELLIAHHPVFFDPVMSLSADEPIGRVAEKIIKSGISVYCAHTNFDACEIGPSMMLARAAGIENPSQKGFIAYGEVAESGAALAQRLRENLDSPYVNVFGLCKGKRVVVCGGSGSGELREVLALGADVYVCGELKYHQLTEYIERGVGVITCGHRESEAVSLPGLAKHLQNCESLIKYKIRYFIADGAYGL